MAWEKTIKENADAEDTVELILSTIRNYSNSAAVRKIIAATGTAKQQPLMQFLKKLFHYAAENFPYQKDSDGIEMIYTPDKILRDGKTLGIDCKKFTTILGAVLLNQKINFRAKVISYDGMNWEHIYIIVPLKDGSYITLDPVNHKLFNKEISHRKARVYDLNGNFMDLKLLGKRPEDESDFISGLDELDMDINGIGLSTDMLPSKSDVLDLKKDLENYFKKSGISGNDEIGRTLVGKIFSFVGNGVKKIVKTVGKVAKTVTLTVPRQAFRGMLSLNILGVAMRFDRTIKERGDSAIKKHWELLGGNWGDLRASITAGVNFHQKRHGKKVFRVDGIGIDPVSASALIAAGTTILVTFLKLLVPKRAEDESSGPILTPEIPPGWSVGDDGMIRDEQGNVYDQNTGGASPQSSSFADLSISNFSDFINFSIKSAIYATAITALLGGTVSLFVVVGSFVFGIRNFFTQIKFTK